MRLIATVIAACSFLGLACAASAAPVSTGSAFATPVAVNSTASVERDAPASDTARLHTIHGCHFDMGPNMAPDRVNGPHYHDNQCRVIRTGPPRGQYRQRDYDDPPRRARGNDGYDERPRRRARESGYYAPPPPVCREECRYRGPFKSCKTICQ